MRFLNRLAVVGLVLAAMAAADTLRLKSGAVIEGTFLGGDARTIRFLGQDGSTKQYTLTDVASIEFGVTPAAPAAAAAPSAAPAPVRATIPAGTIITVRMIDAIDAQETAVGTLYRCSIDDPIVVGNQTVIPRGADCQVQVARAQTGGRLAGSTELELKLHNVTVGGRAYDVATESAEIKTAGEGRKTAQKAGGGAALGAIIGGIAGGGRGAAIGAAAGGGAGVAVAAAKGPHLQIPSETRLTFRLREELPIS